MDTLSSGDFIKMFDFTPASATQQRVWTALLYCLGRALDGLAVKPKRYSYEGPFGVGYGICSFEITGTDRADFERIYLENEGEAKKRKTEEDPMSDWRVCPWRHMSVPEGGQSFPKTCLKRCL